MNVTLLPRPLAGTVFEPVASKSLAHRALICAAFADEPTEIECNSASLDIAATVGALRALGAKIETENGVYRVEPVSMPPQKRVSVDCGESGSTLRFLLPVIGALGIEAEITGSQRLAERPLDALREALTARGMTISRGGVFPLSCSGQLCAGGCRIDGSVSSQYVSGLLLALSLLPQGGTVEVTGELESRPYVSMTAAVLGQFGVKVACEKNKFTVAAQSLRSPSHIKIEGDWSNAAFWLAAGALSESGVTVASLNPASIQGDREIIAVLKKFGARVTVHGDSVTVRRGELCGTEIDAADIPDLVPVLAVLAAAARGTTVIRGVSRLRFKESDRIESIAQMLRALGAKIEADDAALTVHGGKIHGGTVNSHGDHRIAMAAAVACCAADSPVTIINAGAVDKSYPGFFDSFRSLQTDK